MQGTGGAGRINGEQSTGSERSFHSGRSVLLNTIRQKTAADAAIFFYGSLNWPLEFLVVVSDMREPSRPLLSDVSADGEQMFPVLVCCREPSSWALKINIYKDLVNHLLCSS